MSEAFQNEPLIALRAFLKWADGQGGLMPDRGSVNYPKTWERCKKCGGYLDPDATEYSLVLAVDAGAGDWPGCGMAMACRTCDCKHESPQVKP